MQDVLLGWFLGLAIYGVVCAAIGYSIGASKGRGPAGWWLGLLLGVVGVIIAVVLPPSEEYRTAEAIRISEAVEAASMSAGRRPLRARPRRRPVRTPNAADDLLPEADDVMPSAPDAPDAPRASPVQPLSGDSGARLTVVVAAVALLVVVALVLESR